MVKKEIKKEKVAILLAAYNGEEFLESQIHSILNQVDVDLDIFINLDKSSDGSVKIIESLEKNFENIFFLNLKKKYGLGAKNFFDLIRHVNFDTYDYIAFADQDDIWMNNKISASIGLLKETNSYGYSSDFIGFWPDGTKKYFKKSFNQTKWDFLFESPGPGCTFVVQAEALQKFKDILVINFETINKLPYHDWTIYAYFRMMNFQWVIDDNAYILYRQHGRNELGVNYGISAYKSRLKFVIDNGYKKNVIDLYNALQTNFHSLKKDFNFSFFFLLVNFHLLRRKARDKLLILVFIIFNKI